MKYTFINRHRRVWPISVQCRVLEASVAGCHEHFVRMASSAQRRHLSDDALLVHINAIQARTRGAYGWPRTWKELLARGIRVGKQRVQKLMQLHGIRAKGKRRFKVTTDSKHNLPMASNLLDRQFAVAEPDKVWAGDITYIATDEGWLFLAVVIDLFSRQVLGWSLRQDMTRDIVIDALRMAWFKRHPSKQAGLIFHSDRGSQYAIDQYRKLLKEFGFRGLRRSAGNPHHDAQAESSMRAIKVEQVYLAGCQTFTDIAAQLPRFIDEGYNAKRLHSALGYLPLNEFESQLAQKAAWV